MEQNIGFEDAAHKAIERVKSEERRMRNESESTGKYASPQLCGIFEADFLSPHIPPMFRFAAHGVTEVRPLRGQTPALRF